ncbi:MAG: hypothetical protein ACP5D9_08950 [Mariniphaga sp.]
MNHQKSKPKTLYSILFIFAVSMGFLEAIVVVYLRELFYSGGFAFPLKPMPNWLFGTEIVRELCTLLMLGTVAWTTGKTFTRRLAAFLFLFGVWDIFYYLALWLFLDWPQSLLTWDILFLIPIAWTGPVLAPVLCSILMIFIAFLIAWKQSKLNSFRLETKELILFFAGAFIVFIAFVFDFSVLIIKGNYLKHFFALAENPEFLNDMYSFVPDRFQWEIFTLGLSIIISGIIPIIKK